MQKVLERFDTGRPRIVVVDDDAVVRRILRLSLQKRGYQVLEAPDAASGLDMIARAHPDVVLLDIGIPDMNGLEVCRLIKGSARFGDPIVFIVTASTGTADRVLGFQAGAADYVTKPIQSAELHERILTHLRLRRANVRLAEAHRLAEERRERLEAEMAAGAALQQRILPETRSTMRGVDWRWRFLPKSTVSGDMLDIFLADREHLVAWVVDVSGHGLDSGLLTVGVAQSIRSKYAPYSGAEGHSAEIRRPPPTPATLLAQIDAEFPFERFQKIMTLSVVILNRFSGETTYATAGFPVPQHITGNRVAIPLLDGGPVIGVGGVGEYVQGHTRLYPGERLFLTTDGLLETQNHAGDQFGQGRLERLVTSTSGLPLVTQMERIDSIVKRFRGSRPQLDDLTYLVIRFDGVDPEDG